MAQTFLLGHIVPVSTTIVPNVRITDTTFSVAVAIEMVNVCGDILLTWFLAICIGRKETRLIQEVRSVAATSFDAT